MIKTSHKITKIIMLVFKSRIIILFKRDFGIFAETKSMTFIQKSTYHIRPKHVFCEKLYRSDDSVIHTVVFIQGYV